ncbi:MAG: AAA family ATPase [Bacillota bacterium]|jgi:MoxR-like ATPase
MKHDEATDVIKTVRDAVSQVIIGKTDAIDMVLTAFLAGGHILIEDVPGVGKTLLAKTLAKCLGLSFGRVQFTPDLLPSDVTGSSVLNMKTTEFEFRKGPVFSDILLADEINRATPRTQSSLLECMEERQVTADGVTYPLSPHFFVMATQNPVELQGTFPLPEAQLDRFLARVRLGYPEEDEERAIVHRFEKGVQSVKPFPVTKPEEILQVKDVANETHLSREIVGYVSEICRATRAQPGVELGASPRATLWLSRAAKSYAFMQGRTYVLPDDVKKLAVPVLAHRLMLSEDSSLHGVLAEEVILAVLERVEVPVSSSEGKP